MNKKMWIMTIVTLFVMAVLNGLAGLGIICDLNEFEKACGLLGSAMSISVVTYMIHYWITNKDAFKD